MHCSNGSACEADMRLHLVVVAMTSCVRHTVRLDVSKPGADLDRRVGALCIGSWGCSAQVIQDVPGKSAYAPANLQDVQAGAWLRHLAVLVQDEVGNGLAIKWREDLTGRQPGGLHAQTSMHLESCYARL